MCQELQIFAVVVRIRRRLSLIRLCDSDFGIIPVDDITIGITCAAVCFHIAHISLAIIIIIIIIIIIELLSFPVLLAFGFMLLQSTLIMTLINPV